MKILKRIKEISRSQISRERALTTTEQISAITHLVNSLEVLANDRNPRNAALVDWNLIKDEYSWAPRHVHDFLGFVSRPGVSRAIHVARAASAISLMIPGTHRHHRAAAGMFLSLTSVITSPRQHFGTDGSDQVAFLAQGVAALARMGEQQPRTVDSCLWFVGLQSSLSYFASGVAKAATSGVPAKLCRSFCAPRRTATALLIVSSRNTPQRPEQQLRLCYSWSAVSP